MKRTLPALFLPQSPLVAVLGQVRFAPVAAMDRYVPLIQDGLRMKGFPQFREESIEEITWNLMPGSTPAFEPQRKKVWHFANAEYTWVVQLTSDAMTLATSAYLTYETPFESNFRTVLAAVHEHAQPQFATRMGLRYVDLIAPEEGLDFDDYLVPALLGLPPADLGMLESFTFAQSRGPTDLGFMTVRCVFLNTGEMLPPDLAGMPLQLQKSVGRGQKIALLDLDHWRQDEFELDVEDALDRLGELHDHLDRAFRKAVTPEALERWRAEKRERKERSA